MANTKKTQDTEAATNLMVAEIPGQGQEVPPVPTEENVVSTNILAELLEAVKSIKAEQQSQKEQFEEEKAQLEAELAAVKARASANPMVPNVLPAGSIDPRTDHPGTIAEKLQIMEEQAAENGQEFDRDRTYRILRGLPVEPVEEFRYMGHVFKTQEELDLYAAKIEAENLRTLGKYGVR